MDPSDFAGTATTFNINLVENHIEKSLNIIKFYAYLSLKKETVTGPISPRINYPGINTGTPMNSFAVIYRYTYIFINILL